MSSEAVLLALDALRAASLWFTKVDLDGDDCRYQNGDDGRTDGKCAQDDAKAIREKIDLAIEALTGSAA